MTAAWSILAILVPWLAGAAVVALLRDRRASHWFTIGVGWLVGQALVIATLYLMLVCTGASYARLALLIIAGIGILAGIGATRRRIAALNDEDESTPENPFDSALARPSKIASRVVLAIILAGLAAKLYPMIVAHACIPIRCDDATTFWLYKAKVVTELDTLPLDPSHDYYQGGSNPNYPILIPLIAAWIPLVAGQWNEQLATLPWLFCYISLFCLIAGGLRRWLNGTMACAAAYLVVSLPLVCVHVYRPGYADLILAAFLCAAVLCLLTWRETHLHRNLLLAGLLLLTAACFKRESPVLAAIAMLAVLAPSWHICASWSHRTCVAVIAWVVAAVTIVAFVVDFSEQADAAGEIGWHPEVWPALGRHLFEWSSFSFLFWLIVAGVAAMILSPAPRLLHRVPILLLSVGLAAFPAAVFLLTPQARFALNDQTPSRLFMQVAPAIVVALAVGMSRLRQSSAEACPLDYNGPGKQGRD